MSNKRVSELNELSTVNIDPNDLLLISDVNAFESKKVKVSSLQSYLLSNGAITASAVIALSASYASSSLSASYSLSSSFVLSSSYASKANLALTANTASYVSSSNIVGSMISASYSLSSSFALRSFSSSFVVYSYGNGKVENSQTSSYVSYTAGIDNGTISHSINSLTASSAVSASYTLSSSYSDNCISASYSLIQNATSASYATFAQNSTTSSYTSFANQSSSSLYLVYDGTTPNGTASWAGSSSLSMLSNTASYLKYNGIPNGTSSYSFTAVSASYSISSSRSEMSANAVSSSYASSCSYVILDTNQYKTYGPYNTTDGTYGTQTSTECSYRNFVISPVEGTTTVLVEALCDVKVPITTTDTDTVTVQLIIEDWTNGSLQSSTILDTSRPNHYITGASVSGYMRQNMAFQSNTTPIVSGSWYTFRVKCNNGATFDGNALVRGVTFFIHTKPNTTLTRTSYPPF